MNCVWMHRCECVVISLSYKCQCILICTYTVNEVNLNLFLVWPRSLEWTVDGCKNGASKWTNYKNLLYVVLVGKTFHLITNIYIRVQFLFSKRGACFYWVPCFYWDIYGMLRKDALSSLLAGTGPSSFLGRPLILGYPSFLGLGPLDLRVRRFWCIFFLLLDIYTI